MIRAASIVLAAALTGAAAVQPAPNNGVPLSPAALRACMARFDVVGQPRHRSADAAADQVLTCHKGQGGSFNLQTQNPDWVMERLDVTLLKGKAARSGKFKPDPQLGARSPVHDDYTNAPHNPKLARGHQAPHADYNGDQLAATQTFFTSNISPQVGQSFNSTLWSYLEEAVREAVCGGRPDVVVITGPVYGENRPVISARRIVVPRAYYKIVYDVQARRAVGFLMDNRAYAKTEYQLAAYVRPIAEIEAETGLDFFPDFGRRDQNRLERSKGAVWGHRQVCNPKS